MRARKGDPRIGIMVRGFDAILASVPTVQHPGEHGPLTFAEIDQTVELMDQLGAAVKAERDAAPEGA